MIVEGSFAAGWLRPWLQPSIAWLEALQAWQHAQMGITGLMLKRLEAAQQVPARYRTADVLAIPIELAQLSGAASLHLVQELAEIGTHAAGALNSSIIEAALNTSPVTRRD